VVGVTQPDGFYFTESVFNATAGQTSFAVTHTVGDVLVFKNGILLSNTEYSETGTTVVLSTACTINDKVVVYNMRAVSTDVNYEFMNVEVLTVGTSSVICNIPPYQLFEAGDKVTFANTGTPTQYTVSTYVASTKTITFTTTLSGVAVGNQIYRYRAASQQYRPFTRVEVDLSAVNAYTPTAISIANGFELLFNSILLKRDECSMFSLSTSSSNCSSLFKAFSCFSCSTCSFDFLLKKFIFIILSL
jgi:hypothetical protein